MKSLVEGLIEAVANDGVVSGWVRDAGLDAPCRMQVVLREMVLAEAVADRFRGDLLRAGVGHGFYGFAAHLRRPLPTGRAVVMLAVPDRGFRTPMMVAVPPLDPPRAASVESLLVEPPGWVTGDLLAYPGCLRLAANYERLGAAAFVDAVFRFALGRWPSAAETCMNVDDLTRGRISAEGLLLDLLASPERADMGPGLPSPFDADFPFELAGGDTGVTP